MEDNNNLFKDVDGYTPPINTLKDDYSNKIKKIVNLAKDTADRITDIQDNNIQKQEIQKFIHKVVVIVLETENNKYSDSNSDFITKGFIATGIVKELIAKIMTDEKYVSEGFFSTINKILETENYTPKHIYNYIMPKNKLANTIYTYTKKEFYEYKDQEGNIKSLIDDKGNYLVDKDLIVSGQNEKEIKTRIILTYDGEDKNLTYSKRLEPFDQDVYDAVISIYHAGNKHFTIQAVYNALRGKYKSNMGEGLEKEIENSINKLWRTFLTIDFTEEARRRGWDAEKTITKGHLLDLRYVDLEAKGKTFTGYCFLDEPIQFQYAKLSGQILQIRMDLLDIDVSHTKEVIIIKNLLFRDIDYMKHGRSSNNIYFDKIHTELGLTNITKQKAEKIRNHTFNILDALVEKGHITGYDKIYWQDGKDQYLKVYKIEIKKDAETKEETQTKIKLDEKTPMRAYIKGIKIILDNKELEKIQVK